ncbi:hypothetical protein Prum_047720 [Phytohabitans rumicis]|uniref:Phenazine biosynthesis protein PhzF n=1 Tax=Phytohabitans rumicis TaxID=1076125 RepID=A0A6V8L691_9ACTN|nr:hypothetical protein Prum_047720 [Phytohabitans rumicis]
MSTLDYQIVETVLILPPTDPAAATYRARIFTPSAELPFAGHPSVGAAVVQSGGPGRVIQECGAGLLPIDVTADGEIGRPSTLDCTVTAPPGRQR